MNGKELDELKPPVRKAIENLTTWVTPAVPSFNSPLMISLIVGP